MKTKIGIAMIALTVMCVSLAFAEINWFGSAQPQAAEDELLVMIRLDLGEDIGLLLTDYTVNGHAARGGIANADKSMIQRDSADLSWSYFRELLDQPADELEVSLRFTVVTEYFEPNYENDYPEECMIPMDAIAFTAGFGETRHVTITGNKAEGYQAALDEQEYLSQSPPR